MNVTRFFMTVAMTGITCICSAQEPQVQADLRSNAIANGRTITLGDIARLRGGTESERILLAGIRLTEAPAPGFTSHLTRRDVQRLLTSAGVYDMVIDGADAVSIMTASTQIDPTDLVRLAQEYLVASLRNSDANLTVTPQAPLPSIQLPRGTVSFHIRGTPEQNIRQSMTVWVDVLLNGNYYQTIPVGFNVSAVKTVWIAKTRLPKYIQPNCTDVEQQKKDISSLPSVPLTGDCANFGLRLSRGLPAGDVLLIGEMEPVPAVSEGDTVKLVLSQGGISIDAGALALTDGLIGQRIPVQPTDSKEAVIATVIAPDTVDIPEKY